VQHFAYVNYGDNPPGEGTSAWYERQRSRANMTSSKKALSARDGDIGKEVAARKVMKQHKEKGHNPGK